MSPIRKFPSSVTGWDNDEERLTRSSSTLRTSSTQLFTRQRLLRIVALLVFLLGVGMAVAAYCFLLQSQSDSLTEDFLGVSADVHNNISSIIDCALRQAKTVQATMTLCPNLTRAEFAALVALGDAIIPGIQGLSWIPRVLNASRAQFEDDAKAEWPGYAIKPPTFMEEYMIVHLIEPVSTNLAAVGFNLFSSAPRKVSMEKARDLAIPVLTPRLTLVQESGTQYGVLYITPVYRALSPPESVAERQAKHAGYVNGVLRIGDLIGGTNPYVELFMFDSSAQNEAESLLFEDAAAVGQNITKKSDVTAREHLVTMMDLKVADRTWMLVTRPKDTLVSRHVDLAPILWLIIIILISALLSVGILMTANKLALDAQLEVERQKLLDRLLPQQISSQMTTRRVSIIADVRPACCVMFLDIVGFTAFTSKMPANTVLFMLRDLFSAVDQTCEAFKVEKIKTIGDCYMAANGLFGTDSLEANAIDILSFALLVNKVCKRSLGKHSLSARCGVNGGEVVCGVLGGTKPHFDIWGDAVNLASRLESTGEPGQIQITSAFCEMLKGHPKFTFTPRGDEVLLKGKGMMKTWWVTAANAADVACDLPIVMDVAATEEIQ